MGPSKASMILKHLMEQNGWMRLGLQVTDTVAWTVPERLGVCHYFKLMWIILSLNLFIWTHIIMNYYPVCDMIIS